MEALKNFELSVLKRLSKRYPCINSHLPYLSVLSRECTGVGMYINFKYIEKGNQLKAIEPMNGAISTNETIVLANLKHGLCFEVDILNGKINFIELVTYGEEWDGSIQSFYFK
jgi:hypothetical protein